MSAAVGRADFEQSLSEVFFDPIPVTPAIGQIAAAVRCPEAFHTGSGVIFNMLPKRAPPPMRPVMKMVSNQVLDA